MGKNHGLFSREQIRYIYKGKYQHIVIPNNNVQFHLHHRDGELEVIVRRSDLKLSWETEEFASSSVKEVVAAIRFFKDLLEEIEYWFGNKVVWCTAEGKRYEAWSKVAARFPQLTVVADS